MDRWASRAVGLIRQSPNPHAAPAVRSRRTWARSLQRALAVVFALLVANNIVVSLAGISRSFAISGGMGRAAIVPAIAALAGSTAFVLYGVRTPAVVDVTCGLVMCAQLVFAAAVPDPSPLPDTWWAWQLMVPVCVLVCGVLPRRTALPVLMVVLVLYAAIRLSPTSGPGHGWTAAASEAALVVVFAVFACLTFPAWRRTAEVADSATAARNRSRAAIDAARAVDRQRRAAPRLLHDEVIHALRAVSLEPGAIEPDTLRALTRQACEALTDGTSVITGVPAAQQGLLDTLETLSARSQVTTTVHCTDAPALPGSVVTALTGAVGEALRNVERHAGVSDAGIDVRSVPGGVHIRVSDQGRGFDPERIPGRLGYRNSIVDRVAEVGGTATIASAPGHGTTVEIGWAVPSAHYADRDSSQRLLISPGQEHG